MYCQAIAQADSAAADPELLPAESELHAMPMISDSEDSLSDNDEDEYDSEDEDSPDNRLHPDLPRDILEQQSRTEEYQQKVTDAFQFGQHEQQPKLIIPDDEFQHYDTPQAEFLAWHYRLGHLPFARIIEMAKRGDLPAHLRHCKPPKCAACMFGKATKRPWRMKAPVNGLKVPRATAPGAVVGVDQLISTIPGLVGQMKGFLTRKRYNVSTVFVDHSFQWLLICALSDLHIGS
jgi:hypothetical protein